jgi:hypothetical protein
MIGPFVEIAAFYGVWPLKEHQAHTVFHEQTRDVGEHAVFFFVGSTALGVVTDLGAFHAQNFRVKFHPTLKIVTGQTDVVDLLYFHQSLPPYRSLYTVTSPMVSRVGSPAASV